jgi:hypothetical protein
LRFLGGRSAGFFSGQRGDLCGGQDGFGGRGDRLRFGLAAALDDTGEARESLAGGRGGLRGGFGGLGGAPGGRGGMPGGLGGFGGTPGGRGGMPGGLGGFGGTPGGRGGRLGGFLGGRRGSPEGRAAAMSIFPHAIVMSIRHQICKLPTNGLPTLT